MSLWRTAIYTEKHFTPFIVTNKNRSLKTKELRDVLPENNKGMNVVPQLLTNDSDRNAMFRMKELWGYMSHIFSDNKRYSKKIKKSQKLSDYEQAVSSLFREQEIIKGGII